MTEFQQWMHSTKSVLRAVARRTYIPHLDADDVQSEMMEVAWKIQPRHDPSVAPFGAYFWRSWRIRKAELLRSAYAVKRPRTESLDDMQVVAGAAPPDEHRVPAPPDSTRKEVLVWWLLSLGYTPGEVQQALKVTPHQYRLLIQRWRTSQVRHLLEGDEDAS